MSKPDGSVMQFDTALLAGSPFSDYLIPGLVLGGVFGIGSLVVAAMGLRRSRLAPFLAFAIGCAQMIWIGVELAIIREFSFLHPTCFVTRPGHRLRGRALGLAHLPGMASEPTGQPLTRSRRSAQPPDGRPPDRSAVPA